MLAFQVKNDRRGATEIKYKQYGDDEWKTADGFRPYFYVDADEGYRLPEGVAGRVARSVEPNAYDGTPLHRVELKTTRDAREAREEAENHFEADIPFERRFFIDRVSGSMVGEGDIEPRRPHIMHVDIEVGTAGSAGPDAMAAAEPVVSASCYSERLDSHLDLLLKPEGWSPDSPTSTDEKGREYVEPDWDDAKGGKVYLFDEERTLLKSLANVISGAGVEVLTGWNVEGFDAAYLINRMSGVEGVSEDQLSPLGESYVSEWTTERGNQRINATIKGVEIFDMYDAYKHLKRRDKPPNWRLGTVAEYESGVDVPKIPFDTSKVTQAWREDPLEVMEYNRRDAVLTHEIAGSLSAFDLFLEMQRAFAMPLSDTLNNSVLVEMYVMSRAPAWGIEDRILDSKRSDENEFEGGNTKEPNPGLYEWVFSVDVTSEYPNWVRAANLSPETVVTPGDEAWERDDLIETPFIPDTDPEDLGPGEKAEDMLQVKFLPHDERLGILPRAVDEMFEMKREKTEKRAQYKYGTDEYEQADMERDATKWFLNSIQGVTGMETHRLSKNEVSAAITSFGRETVEFMKDVGERMGYAFVYADTDSAFFHDPDGGISSTEEVVRATKEVRDRVNDQLPLWARSEYGIEHDNVEHLEVEPDKVAKRAFFPNKKKRYTLWLVWDDGDDVDKISHTGWAIVRSDTSDVEYRVQKKTLEALMHNRSESYVNRRLREEIMSLVAGDYEPIELARPQGSSKRFEMYGDNRGELDFENVPYFVAAMVSSNELLGTEYDGGDKAWMLPVEETEAVQINNSVNSVNYLAIDEDTELPDWVEIDYAKVIDNITGKVERVYDSLGWSKEPLRSARADALQEIDVQRIQEDNHTLGAFTS